MTNWVEMVVLDLNSTRCHVLRLGFGWYKMNVNHICKKQIVDTLVLIRVSFQAAKCAWPWLNIISNKGAYQGTSSHSAFSLMFVLGRRYRLDVIGQLTSQWRNLILIGIFRNLVGEHMLIYLPMSILLITFAWFWSKCCFQIPGPGVRGPGIWKQHLDQNHAKVINSIDIGR